MGLPGEKQSAAGLSRIYNDSDQRSCLLGKRQVRSKVCYVQEKLIESSLLSLMTLEEGGVIVLDGAFVWVR